MVATILNVCSSEYKSSKYIGMIVHLLKPRCSLIIFRTKKIICIATRRLKDANLRFHTMARISKKLDYNVKVSSFTCNNIVDIVSLRFFIILDYLLRLHKQFAFYNPNIFLDPFSIECCIRAQKDWYKIVFVGVNNIGVTNAIKSH